MILKNYNYHPIEGMTGIRQLIFLRDWRCDANKPFATHSRFYFIVSRPVCRVFSVGKTLSVRPVPAVLSCWPIRCNDRTYNKIDHSPSHSRRCRPLAHDKQGKTFQAVFPSGTPTRYNGKPASRISSSVSNPSNTIR